MAEYTRTLPVEGPRQYTLRDAYRGRVWRSRSVVLGKELLSWAIAATLFGFLLDHGLLFSLGFVACVGAVLIMTIGSIFTNQHRVQMIRHGKAASGTMQQAGRILVLHELLKPEREKTFVLKYRYTDDDGQMHHSRIWEIPFSQAKAYRISLPPHTKCPKTTRSPLSRSCSSGPMINRKRPVWNSEIGPNQSP